ncbi:Ribosome-associated heat shock protein implicated in the recycling of the 50S subunit [Rubellimicrobium mesophilum DSM 19309]|uniref:Ribosome-associated heat shock protein implicated in the recycling of the 50S subunit n=1 Tax=Rubellimicrobium mesophilum DSM 19309 TaxID=442562 RepID=A0A017HCW8_9RHOB|nr:RNA-binding S4 domain-containing protein [Rubellimicrobium mesophilum]EYD72140.1 Ribosome-associated heat shock protein implicated in the recycling of the 50S subunit [Rubellimicrobium mesophilum DSM 19309]
MTNGRPDGTGEAPRETIRLDKWLFQARFLKSRGLAADLIGEGKVRVNGQPTDKPARAVGPGDVLTFALHGRVRVVRILDVGERRGPAPEAQALYEDLAPQAPQPSSDSAPPPLE